MKNSFCIRYNKDGYPIKRYNIIPVRQPNNVIKTTPATAQAPKVLALRVKEVSDNNKSKK
jgi:hypothetical protein